MSSIQLASDTLAGSPGSGQVEYNGQFYGTDSNSSRAQFERLVQSTAQNTTSGTSITFSSIPAWAKKITVMFNGVSTSGTSVVQVQLGAGSVTTTGYVSTNIAASGSIAGSGSVTSGFNIENTGVAAAANVATGIMIISNLTGNTWVEQFAMSLNTTTGSAGGGSITLGGTLDRVVITTVNGTDTFDAGSINIMYEG